MTREPYTIDDEIKDVSHGKPHVVVLGAGASIAATPNGDAAGRKLPSMANFINVLEMAPLLTSHGVPFDVDENFEVLYARLHQANKFRDALAAIEEHVSNYFRQLELPSSRTVYDDLVLSLRAKDLIATFNWDPFLYQACARNYKFAPMPRVVYLHGNVASGFCLDHRTMGMPGSSCSQCGKPFKPSSLLFPVTVKGYNNDPFVASQWKALQAFLKGAYQLTIFGYGAPSSDVEAVSLMKVAWGKVENRELEQTEIIDIRDENELADLWNPFIHSHHYEVHSSFGKSWLAKHPRRTCEAAWQQFMECQFLADNHPPDTDDLETLRVWIEPLIKAEQ